MSYPRSAIMALFLAASSVTAAYGAGPSYRIEVAGLSCPFCAYGIEKQLSGVDGVERVEVDLKAGAVIVTMKDGASLEESEARQAVEDAGFTLNGFARAADGDPQ